MASGFGDGVGRPILLSAGGTGGHLFPAQALAEELTRRGHAIHLLTDERVKEYGNRFPAEKVHVVPSSTLTPRRPSRLPGQLRRLASGVIEARAIMARLDPLAVVGFGGYPSFPPLVAAMTKGVVSFIHEQNAVVGRANRALANGVAAIASSFPTLLGLPSRAAAKVTCVGNPVRDAVVAASRAPYAAPEEGRPFRLLVFGGSQGTRIFSEAVPAALEALPPAERGLLAVTQQVRPEDMDGTRSAYRRGGIDAELAPFFHDMPERIAGAHLVLARSGASTVAELAAIGRPAILVPLPHSLDNDQLLNARAFVRSGGGWLLEQSELSAERLSSSISGLLRSERRLREAAEGARSIGRPDAAIRLADLVENVAGARASDGPAPAKGRET